MTEELAPSQEIPDGEKLPPKPETQWSEVEAQANASLSGQEKARSDKKIAENADRKASIEFFLVDNDLFGFEPYSPEILNNLTILLVDIESKRQLSNSEFDVTTDWSEKKITRFFERKLDDAEMNDTANTEEKEDREYIAAVKNIREQSPNISNVDLCKTLIEGSFNDENGELTKYAESIPTSEMANVQGFVDMKNLAATPEDQAIVEAKINALDFSNGVSDPVLFLQSSIFTDPAISEASKDAMAQRFNVTRFKTNTGSQVDTAMDAVNEAGEPLHDESNPLTVRHGVDAYVKPDGSRVARVNVDGIGMREIPWERGERGEIIGLKISMLKIWAINEAKGVTDFMGENVNINTYITGQTDPEKLRKTQQIMEGLLGGNAGYNGEIITNEQAQFLSWFNQYTSIKGDANEGDYDKATAVSNRTDLGLHPNGNPELIDYEVLRAAGSFAQAQYGTGSPDYYSLQKHLHELFPDRVPLTGENEPDEV